MSEKCNKLKCFSIVESKASHSSLANRKQPHCFQHILQVQLLQLKFLQQLYHYLLKVNSNNNMSYGTSVPQWTSEEFTLYVGHMFKHVPAKMVFSVFRNMGLGMLKRGDEAITFRDYKDHRKSAKINFKFLFTRGDDDAENNIQILEHLRSGGPDAHIQVTYQTARRNPKTGKDEPDRFWKVKLWRERTQSPEQDSKPRKAAPSITLSGGKLGKEKKVVQKKIKLVAPASDAPGAPKKAKRGVRDKTRNLPPLDLSGLDGPEDYAQRAAAHDRLLQEAGSQNRHEIKSPDYHPTSPPYYPTSPGLLYMNTDGSHVTADGAPHLPPSPDYSPPKSLEPKKSVTFSDEDDVHEIPARDNEPSLPRCDADHPIDQVEEVSAPEPFVSLVCKEMPGDDVKIVFEGNRRRKGTAVWARYEKYQVATTIKEARELGATPADIKKDFEKGWFILAAP